MAKKFYIYPILIMILTLQIFNTQVSAKEHGTLDLCHQNQALSNLNLDGEWYFFHEEFLTYEDLTHNLEDAQDLLVKIPSSFKEVGYKTNTFGTYVLKVKIHNSLVNEALAIEIPYQYSAYQLMMNETLIAKNGTIGKDDSSHEAMMAPKVAYFTPHEDEFYLIFQISSFNHIRGGFENSIILGQEEAIIQKVNIKLIFDLFAIGSIFTIGILLMLLTIHQREAFDNLIFGLFAVFIALRALFGVPFYYTFIFPNMSWLWGTRFEYVLTEGSAALFFVYMWFLYKDMFSEKIMKLTVYTTLVTMIITLFTQPLFFQKLFFIIFYLTVLVSLYILYIVIQSFRHQTVKTRTNLIGISIVLLAATNDFFVGQNLYQFENLVLYAVAIYIFIQMRALSKDHARYVHQQESLNETLNLKVKERTQQLETANAHLVELASKDGLTSIFNRAVFNETIEDVFNNVKIKDYQSALLMMDIDNFKFYNDTYGHIKGDDALKLIVKIIQDSLPQDTFFARYGGEEFAVIMENTNHHDALMIAENIKKNIDQKQIENKNASLTHIAISIGVSILKKNSNITSVTDWITAADNKLYESKLKGKNTGS